MNGLTISPELALSELEIGVLNTTHFRVIPIATSRVLALRPVVYLECLPRHYDAMTLDNLNQWSLTPGEITDLLYKRSIIEEVISCYIPSLKNKLFSWEVRNRICGTFFEVKVVVGKPSHVFAY